jgi:hypothetical protein
MRASDEGKARQREEDREHEPGGWRIGGRGRGPGAERGKVRAVPPILFRLCSLLALRWRKNEIREKSKDAKVEGVTRDREREREMLLLLLLLLLLQESLCNGYM